MKITEVTIDVHEKRNHPTEYGHRDASVRLTATVDEDEGQAGGVDYHITQLRTIARNHVEHELELWIESIERQRRIDNALHEVRRAISWIRADNRVEYAKRALRHIRELPPHLEAEWRRKLGRKLEQVADESADEEELSGQMLVEEGAPF